MKIGFAKSKSVLTITDSDVRGSSGIQADLKIFAAHGCYGTTAITALTAYNAVGGHSVYSTPPDFMEKQIRSILHDIEVHAIKVGTLYNAEIIRAVVKALSTHCTNFPSPPLIWDLACITPSGENLPDPLTIQSMVNELFPMANLIISNRLEAEMLLSYHQKPSQISSIEAMITATQHLLQLGPSAVLLKGDHISTSIEDINQIVLHRTNVTVISHGFLEENMEIIKANRSADITLRHVVDVLNEGENIVLFVHPMVNFVDTHGARCTLSAAIASQLAHGIELIEAVKRSLAYTHIGIETAPVLGNGHRSPNHFHAILPRSVPRSTKTDRYPFTRLLIQANAREWKEYVQHDFVKLLGRGTLPRKAFVHYLIQGYHYLKYYSRAYGLLAAKSMSFKSIESAAQTIISVITHITTQESLYSSFGITKEILENTPEALATTAYGAYVVDVGFQGDSMKLLMAPLACLLGYGEAGLWLKKQASMHNSWVVLDGNPYKRWIDDCAGEVYQGAVKLGLEFIETQVAIDSPSQMRFEEWKQVWERCTRFEKGFWDAAIAAA